MDIDSPLQPYEAALFEEAQRNPKLVVLTAENRSCIRQLPKLLGDRFIDVGICEQTLIGVAAGLAKEGYFPVVHALAAFLTMRAFEFIRTDLAYPQLPCALVGTFGGFLSSANGPTHQAIEDIALMSMIPNVNVFAPADVSDCKNVVSGFSSLAGPLYIRYHDGPSPDIEREPLQMNKNECWVKGRTMALVSYGPLMTQTLNVRELLLNHGIEASVYNARFISRTQTEFFSKLLEDYDTVACIEDHRHIGGLANMIQDVSYAKGSSTRLLPINLGDRFFIPARAEECLSANGFSEEELCKTILSQQ